MKRKPSPAALAPPAAAVQSGRLPRSISYRGWRDSTGKYRVTKDGQDLVYKRADGEINVGGGPWEWGRRCPWAELLTWELLVDVLDDTHRAAMVAKQFSENFTFRFHPRGWMMSAANILAAVERLEREENNQPRHPK